MATYHIRVNPKNVPDDWHDDSLRRAAIHINQAWKIPAVFSEDSLEYLRERQTQVQDRLAISRPTITKDQIVAALARDGISVEDK